MIVEGHNPVSISMGHKYTWQLGSFKTEEALAVDALDESDFDGFGINKVLYQLKTGSPPRPVALVVNADSTGREVRNGRMPVNDMRVSMAFPDDVETGDYVVLESPAGFLLQSTYAEPSRKQCKAFKWLPLVQPVPGDGNPPAFDFGKTADCATCAPRCERNVFRSGFGFLTDGYLDLFFFVFFF